MKNKHQKCNICNALVQGRYSEEKMEVYRWVKKYGSIQKERKAINMVICKSCYHKLHPYHKLFSIAACVSAIAPAMILFSLINKGAFSYFLGGAIAFLMAGIVSYCVIFGLFALAIIIVDDFYIAAMSVKPFDQTPLVHTLTDYGYYDYKEDEVKGNPPIGLDIASVPPFETVKADIEKNFSVEIK